MKYNREQFNNAYAWERGFTTPSIPFRNSWDRDSWYAGQLAGSIETARRGTKVNRHLSDLSAADWRQARALAR
jgi:hypothetical protein